MSFCGLWDVNYGSGRFDLIQPIFSMLVRYFLPVLLLASGLYIPLWLLFEDLTLVIKTLDLDSRNFDAENEVPLVDLSGTPIDCCLLSSFRLYKSRTLLNNFFFFFYITS
jgi:hypothetical protein